MMAMAACSLGLALRGLALRGLALWGLVLWVPTGPADQAVLL